jgi:hypothetical protein
MFDPLEELLQRDEIEITDQDRKPALAGTLKGAQPPPSLSLTPG